ncbi:LLM class flavin-dependent oxidoreductase [Candidatus Entotheonella palauensis]|uniref:LLM class flavin-dependent oxidoreductase n=1 Tax=Candidatus Entotheonella palauensis TaxID=93172 RepID=UPI000B7F7760|nr:LLM class flavin-dependent oxidoreductase [Candidatus Entotheonella palauensis]
MAIPELGLGLFPTEAPSRLVEVAREAEQLGYSHLWMGDSQAIWREVYVNLGAVAMATQRMVLGTGVTNPVTRHLSVTASALATLGELTGGRVALGIGAGDSAVETVGRRPSRLAGLETAILTLRHLMAGEAVEVEQGTMRLDWLEAPQRIPIIITASGPNLLRLAGKVADGAIILVGTAPEYLQGALDCIRQGAKEAGRDLEAEGFKTICWTPCSIGDNGDAARDHVKSHVARVLKRPLPFTLSEDDQAVVRHIYEHYEYYQHMVVGAEHSELVPDRMVPRFAIAGTVAECREQVQQLAASGIHQVSIIPHTPNPADRLATIRTFAQEVVGAL